VGISNKQVPVTWQSLDENYQIIDGEWTHLLSLSAPPRTSPNHDTIPEGPACFLTFKRVSRAL
jgi:hypothetical protein